MWFHPVRDIVREVNSGLEIYSKEDHWPTSTDFTYTAYGKNKMFVVHDFKLHTRVNIQPAVRLGIKAFSLKLLMQDHIKGACRSVSQAKFEVGEQF